jgi:hypothetical protein
MAKPPWFENERLLHAALRKAASTLRAQIDRLEIIPGKVLFRVETKFLFWTRTKELAVSYQFIADPTPVLGPSPKLLVDGVEPEPPTGRMAGRTALPRWGEREELLHACISKATMRLNASVDRATVSSDKVLAGTGSQELCDLLPIRHKPKRDAQASGLSAGRRRLLGMFPRSMIGGTATASPLIVLFFL